MRPPLKGTGVVGGIQRMTLSEMESVFYQKGVLCIVIFISGGVWPTTPTHPNTNPLEEMIENCLPGIPNIINTHFDAFRFLCFFCVVVCFVYSRA